MVWIDYLVGTSPEQRYGQLPPNTDGSSHPQKLLIDHRGLMVGLL